MVVDFDDDLQGFFEASVSGTWTAGECTVGAGNVVTCDDADTIALVNSTVVIQFLPPAFPDTIVAPTVPSAACTVFDTDVTVQCTELAAGDLDDLTVLDWVLDPLNSTNPTNAPDQAHTVVFSLPLNITCESDTSNDGVRTCGAGDVVISDTQSSITLSSGPTVTDSVLSNPSDVTVVVNSPQATVGTITLSVHHDNADGTFADIVDPVASKTYAVVNGAGGTGEIRHLDEADQATEDAAAVDIDAYCASASIPVFDCGILDAQDDADDAVGSFHQACMINTNLTHAANSADITWNIAPGPGSSATVNPNPNGVNVAGPTDEPCVRW